MRELNADLVSDIDWAFVGPKWWAILVDGRVYNLHIIPTESGCYGWAWLDFDDPYVFLGKIYGRPVKGIKAISNSHIVYEFETHQEFLAWSLEQVSQPEITETTSEVMA